MLAERAKAKTAEQSGEKDSGQSAATRDKGAAETRASTRSAFSTIVTAMPLQASTAAASNPM